MVTRIRQLLDWQQLSSTQFADLIGVGRPVMSHILSERNKPSLEVYQRIVKALPAVSKDWLLDGTGNMLTEPVIVTPPAASPAAIAPAATSPVAALAGPAPRRAAALPRPAPARFVQPRTAQAVGSAAPTLLEAASGPVASSAPLTGPTVAPVPAAAPWATAALPAGSLEPQSPAITPAPTAGMAGVAELDKAIRRIVIFYRDGSFVDYQPEG